MRKTLQQQLARMSPEYDLNLKRWIDGRIFNDRQARYFAIAINNLTIPKEFRGMDRFLYLRKELTKACEATSKILTPSFSRSNPRRNNQDKSVGLIVLPAVIGDFIHLHGWIRVPVADRQNESAVISEHQQYKTVLVPSAVKVFFKEVRERFQTTNVWIANNDGRAMTDLRQGFAAGDYLLWQRKRESRQWGLLELIPGYLFRSVDEQIEKKGRKNEKTASANVLRRSETNARIDGVNAQAMQGVGHPTF